MKLESLDIDLNTLSVILFFFSALFTTSMTLVIFSGTGNKNALLFILMTYIINQIVYLYYGIVTNQIGFILMVAFQFFMLLSSYLYLNQNIPSILERNDDGNN